MFQKNVKLLKITLICNISVATLGILKTIGVIVYYTLFVLTLVNILQKTPEGWKALKTFFWALLLDTSVIFLEIGKLLSFHLGKYVVLCVSNFETSCNLYYARTESIL